MDKATALEQWRQLAPGANPLEHMAPIPYKAQGSKYGACGIRIDGTPAFINAVLSNLKGLLAGENQVTRLELARRPVEPVEINGERKMFFGAGTGEVCYIRLHMRGHEGTMLQAYIGDKAATNEFARVNKYARE